MCVLNLLESLKEKILIGDGAMGTILYANGVDRCFEELNMTQPEQVLNVHKAYIDAGANVIQTNTYGANYSKLARYGLEDEVKRFNTAAVKIAKKAAGDDAFVIGNIGGIHGTQTLFGTPEEIKRGFREQLYCLLLEGVDGLILETYYNLDELKTVLKIAREETDIPIITNVSMHEAGILENGIRLPEAFATLEQLGADVVGVNCRLGPHHMIQSLREVPLPEKAFLAAYPNASLPEYRDGKMLYENKPDYFENSAQQLRNEGIRLIGGCCGTTPDHIRAIAKGVRGLVPLKEKKVLQKERQTVLSKATTDKEKPLHEIVKERTSIIVELDTPKHLDTQKFLEGAKKLKDIGVDAITLADNSLASPRICNASIAAILKREIGITPLVHLTCRDRNLIGLQSHLMGLHTTGIHEILAITGDPSKLGDFPGATSVFDVNSFKLIELIQQFNRGLLTSGRSLKQSTSFNIAVACNPNANRLAVEVKRLEKKITNGANYVLTQPVYCTKKIAEFREATKHLDIPIYIGIMPLTSSKNAEFMHHEVPGIKLTDEVRGRMRAVEGNREKSAEESIEISKELVDVALEHFNGIYFITPFMRYELIVALVEYIHQTKARLVY